jgi:penicillin-insensitive murein endopeptidase
LGAVLSPAAGCTPGFFAEERWPVVAPAEAEVIEPPARYTTGCSPKGCLPDAGGASARGGDNALARAAAVAPVVHPLLGTANAEIDRLVSSDLESLGSMSFGTATRGGLLNSVHLPAHERWTLVDPPNAWGTSETVAYLVHAVDRVRSRFPGSHPLFVGDLSRRRGGHLKPHLSHQSGKDADISYYYTQDPQWYARAHAGNLDRERSWALIRTLIAETDVHYIFMDRSVQRLLRSYAEAIGEDREWLSSIFHGTNDEEPIIRHEPGHATHIHVRFYNPIAEETARRC